MICRRTISGRLGRHVTFYMALLARLFDIFCEGGTLSFTNKYYKDSFRVAI